VLRNVASTWMVTLVTIATTYILTPFVIHTLGTDGYGTWTLIASLTAYISLLALGVRWPASATCGTRGGRRLRPDEQGHRELRRSVSPARRAAVVIGTILAAVFHLYGIPPVFRTQAGLAYG